MKYRPWHPDAQQWASAFFSTDRARIEHECERIARETGRPVEAKAFKERKRRK